MSKNKAASKRLLGVLTYSAVLLAVIFYAAREAFIEFAKTKHGVACRPQSPVKSKPEKFPAPNQLSDFPV